MGIRLGTRQHARTLRQSASVPFVNDEIAPVCLATGQGCNLCHIELLRMYVCMYVAEALELGRKCQADVSSHLRRQHPFALVGCFYPPHGDICITHACVRQVEGIGVRVLFPRGVEHAELVVPVRGAQVRHLPDAGERG